MYIHDGTSREELPFDRRVALHSGERDGPSDGTAMSISHRALAQWTAAYEANPNRLDRGAFRGAASFVGECGS